MVDEVRPTSYPTPAHREPLPSLGMVAHIWAGHLAAVDVTDVADMADDRPGLGTVEVPVPRSSHVEVD